MSDLNRRIAELRGECPHKYVQRINSLGTKYSECMTCKQRGDYDKGPTVGDYYENIQHAMEPWDEMVKAGLYPILRTIEIDHGEYGYRVDCDKSDIMEETYTVSQAICQAYIKFKEVGE